MTKIGFFKFFWIVQPSILIFTAALLSITVFADKLEANDSLNKQAFWTTFVDDSGVRWLKSSQGPVYSKGVNVINEGKDKGERGYFWKRFYTTKKDCLRDSEFRLKSWGFNTAGGWSNSDPEIGLPLIPEIDLGRHARLFWFDIFSPSSEKVVTEKAREIVAPYKDNPRVIGYFTDNEAGWWNSPLFEWHLKQGWENWTKKTLWNLLWETYAGDWAKLCKDFVPASGLTSFAELKKAGAILKLRPEGQGIRVVNLFMNKTASRYYSLIKQALNDVHPGALIVGDRLPLYYHQDALRALLGKVDIVSTNYNVDVPDGWIAPYYFETLEKISGLPVLVSEFFFAAQENRSGNKNNGHLMTVKSQAARAAGAKEAICILAGFPNVIGAHWFQYYDEPTGGRDDGEDYNMGLVDINNRPYERLTDMFAETNPQLEKIHAEACFENAFLSTDKIKICKSAKEKPNRPLFVYPSEERIIIGDNSLLDWPDKKRSRVLGFKAQAPYAPFGDVHLAWRPEGLYLSSLASCYIDPRFLAYTGEFPLSEAYLVEIKIKLNDGAVQIIQAYLTPVASREHKDRFGLIPRLFIGQARTVELTDQARMQEVATAGRLVTLNNPLPHIQMELFIPAVELGLTKLSPGQNLDLQINLRNFYREINMFLEEPAENFFIRAVLK